MKKGANAPFSIQAITTLQALNYRSISTAASVRLFFHSLKTSKLKVMMTFEVSQIILMEQP